MGLPRSRPGQEQTREETAGSRSVKEMVMAKDWNPSSWRAKAIEQVPAYPDANALA